ncbi:hypothetical protein [Sorangium sp. So ce204]|uniref:hypothetical protein n=1 Tax=Sorangium sp. So ce204 TaxID=3133288 RepID=UPI003F644C40
MASPPRLRAHHAPDLRQGFRDGSTARQTSAPARNARGAAWDALSCSAQPEGGGGHELNLSYPVTTDNLAALEQTRDDRRIVLDLRVDVGSVTPAAAASGLPSPLPLGSVGPR